MKLILISHEIPAYILKLIDQADIMHDNLNNLLITIDLYIQMEDPFFLDVTKIFKFI